MRGARGGGPPWNPLLANVLLAVLVAGGLGIRVHRIDEPLMSFHPTRQYRSAIIARSCYYDVNPSVPAWSRDVAQANRKMQPQAELPLMEWLACAGYSLVGRETFAVPGVLAVTWWVLGVLPLYRLSLRLTSAASALAGVAVYLFLPYGIVASRSFQPDGLMTMCALWTTLQVVRYYEDPTPRRLFAAALLIALSTLVKPMSIFFTLAALAGVSIAARGWRRAWTSPDFYTLAGLGLLPAAVYYGSAALFGQFSKDQLRLRFVPDLLGSSFFWRGWLTQIRRVFGVPLLVAALAGVPLARPGLSRNLQAGLWIGYVLFAIAFTYHMPTHDYYHLPFIAAVALGIATCVGRLESFLLGYVGRPAAASFALVVALVVAVAGSAIAWPHLNQPAIAKTTGRYEEIGELAGHDLNVLFLDLEYGYPLMYHGHVSGDAWPTMDDLAAESLGGTAPIDADTRFARDYADFGPRYFVVTDLASFDAQPDLQRLLERRATLVKKTAAYRVYRFVP